MGHRPPPSCPRWKFLWVPRPGLSILGPNAMRRGRPHLRRPHAIFFWAAPRAENIPFRLWGDAAAAGDGGARDYLAPGASRPWTLREYLGVDRGRSESISEYLRDAPNRPWTRPWSVHGRRAPAPAGSPRIPRAPRKSRHGRHHAMVCAKRRRPPSAPPNSHDRTQPFQRRAPSAIEGTGAVRHARRCGTLRAQGRLPALEGTGSPPGA